MCAVNVTLSQVDAIPERAATQSWDGVKVVHDLPERGPVVKVTRPFTNTEVVCDYHRVLLSHKDGKAKYEASVENAMGFMFAFTHSGTRYWCDATDEVPGPGRLINHSRCHDNVSITV